MDSDDETAPAQTPPEDAPAPAPAPAPTPPEDAPAPEPEEAPAPAPVPVPVPASTSQEDAPAATPPEDAPGPHPCHPQAPFRLHYQAYLEESQRHRHAVQRERKAEERQRQEAARGERERRAAERERRRRRRVAAEASQSIAEVHGSSEEEGSAAEASQSTAEIHGSSEEEGSTIMDTSQQQTLLHVEDGSSSTDTKHPQRLLHEEDQLPDWMSQLFEKLDLEASKDDESIGYVAQAEAHPLAEESISFEIQRSSEEKDSTISEKRELEVNTDGIGSLPKVSQGERPPLDEGGVSTKKEYPCMAVLDPSGLDDRFDEWFSKMVGGSEDDVSSLPEVDQEENCIDSDELYDLIDKEVKEYCKNMKKVSYKETIENGFKWMSEECFLAFTNSAEKLHFEGVEHKFGELHSQCFSVESHDKIFHHYNFTIEETYGNSDVWTSKLYFAEVKQFSGVKSFLCCLLEQNDCGHCYGCQNQDVYDLKHPSRGGYYEGHSGICWPFMDDPDYDSGSDDGCVLGN